MKVTVFWVVVPCSPVEANRLLRGACFFHNQGVVLTVVVVAVVVVLVVVTAAVCVVVAIHKHAVTFRTLGRRSNAVFPITVVITFCWYY